MWRVHCRLFGPEGEPRWFVVKDLEGGGMEYFETPHGRPVPFRSEEEAFRRAEEMNQDDRIVVTSADWIDFDARR